MVNQSCWSGFMGKKSHREKYGACLIRDKQPWAYVSRPPCMPPAHPPAVSYLCQGIHFMQSKNLPRKARWPPLPNLCQGLSQHLKSVSYHFSRTNVWPPPVLIASALRLAWPDLTLECVNWGFSLKFSGVSLKFEDWGFSLKLSHLVSIKPLSNIHYKSGICWIPEYLQVFISYIILCSSLSLSL